MFIHILFAREELLNEKSIQDIAKKYGKSKVQVILRWHLQEGIIAIPKSTNPEHIKSNLNIFDFELSEPDMDAIRALDRNMGFFNMPEEEQERNFTTYKIKL